MLLSTKYNQRSEREAESSAKEKIPNQLNRHSSGDSKSYYAEPLCYLVPKSLSFNPRRWYISLITVVINNHALGKFYDPKKKVNQTSYRLILYQLSYQSVSNIAKTRKSIQGVILRQTL